MAELEGNAGKASAALNKKRGFSYSLNSLSIIAAVLLLAVTLAVVAFVSYYYQTKFKDQYLEYTVRLQSQFNRSTASEFNTLDLQLFQLGEYNTNVSLINTTSDPQVFYRAKMTLYKELSNLAPVFPRVDGLFFYSPAADDYTPFIVHTATSECSISIKKYLEENGIGVLSETDLFHNWQLARENGNSYLVRYVKTGSSVLGAWTSLPTLLSSFRSLLPEESVISMLDPDYRLLQARGFADYVFDPAAASHYQEYTAADHTRYIVNTYKTSYSGCHLIICTPVSLVVAQMSPVYKSVTMIMLVIVLITAVLSIMLKKLIDQPIRPMRKTLQALQAGTEKTPVLVTDSRCAEVRQMFGVLNSMLGDIRTLEAQVYEDQLAQSRLELQFLKSQITPHFLINCLNTFSYLASSPEESDHAAAQRLTQTLSQHIRYSFATGEMISLEREFDHLDNYLELACIRYPGSLSYELHLPEDCRQAGIPPMALLTLCENTVKHNLIMGEWLKITVSAQTIQTEDSAAVHICFIDNGTGYPPEALERNNSILDHPETVRDGKHIGIYNIVKSIQLVFKDRAQVVFSNEPGAGARVDIRIPYVVKEEAA